MKNYFKKIALIISLLPTVTFAATWTAPLSMQHSYFEGVSSASIALVMSNNFHSCGSNLWGTIRQNVIGDVPYKTLAAVILTANATGQTISLKVDGCQGSRAKVIGVRLSQ